MRPEVGPRCGACRLGLPSHNPADPQCIAHGDPRHRGEPRRCSTCGRPETSHHMRHPFTHPHYDGPEHHAAVAFARDIERRAT